MQIIIERILALCFLIILSPIFGILFIVVRSTSDGAFLFSQARMGKNKKPFYIYKIRTMVKNAETLKKKYQHFNEADGPVFKIRNDPRFTKVGKWLAQSGLDELPQLINIVKGEMAFVGPRPLPIDEANRIPKKYSKRFDVLPGVTSPWVINGNHKLSFQNWMKLDMMYLENKSVIYDIKVAGLSAVMILRNIFL